MAMYNQSINVIICGYYKRLTVTKK